MLYPRDGILYVVHSDYYASNERVYYIIILCVRCRVIRSGVLISSLVTDIRAAGPSTSRRLVRNDVDTSPGRRQVCTAIIHANARPFSVRDRLIDYVDGGGLPRFSPSRANNGWREHHESRPVRVRRPTRFRRPRRCFLRCGSRADWPVGRPPTDASPLLGPLYIVHAKSFYLRPLWLGTCDEHTRVILHATINNTIAEAIRDSNKNAAAQTNRNVDTYFPIVYLGANRGMYSCEYEKIIMLFEKQLRGRL